MLFIPGNAGSYRQVRPIAAEAARYFHEKLEVNVLDAATAQPRNLDFFTVDFNEDITAFHGQTLLDQAEYLNEAVRYILSLYMDPRMSDRETGLPDPTSVLILGHSMGGVVARTMLTIPNYQTHSINTILTMSAPHSRAPVTFDGQIVETYDKVNDYWRQAYSQKWANNNPLWHVTLVSIAGGGLDTVVPSDYASVESIVPETHGFTVFTTGIPTVWTSMDHQAILWCDQFRKVVTRAMYDVLDVHRSSQTKPRAERMRIFRKWFLTGMESRADLSVSSAEPTILLTLDTDSNPILAQGERLVLRGPGQGEIPRAHLLPIPPQGSSDGKQFTFLTDGTLDETGSREDVDILLCIVSHRHMFEHIPVQIDLSADGQGSTHLACKNAATDKVLIPASTNYSRHPFVTEKQLPTYQPLSYLRYDLEDLADHHFVAVIDKTTERTKSFILAEFSDYSQSYLKIETGLGRLLAKGLTAALPTHRPIMTEISLSSLQSSLIAYHLRLNRQPCGYQAEMFAPVMRQHLAQPYETKFFVNVENASISVHGVAPYVPPPLMLKHEEDRGLKLQFWTDPTCDSMVEITLQVDILGSLGKLYMRYRTVFAAFPLLIVALVLRKQFKVYDSTGVFISFSESLDASMRQSLPLVLLSLTLLSLSVRGSESIMSLRGNLWRDDRPAGSDFHANDLLTGTQDPIFWFLMPLIGIVCVGVCAILHYMTVGLTLIMSFVYRGTIARPIWQKHDGLRQAQSPAFIPSSPRRRIVVIACLLFMVATFIPYQFAYLVACLVQLFTAMRALRIASDVGSPASFDFYNYAHSILLLMLWVLPINVPTLAVWLRNLLVQWLTPFSSHHNVFSIMPFLVLVETLSSGNMVPRMKGKLRHLTSVLLFGTALYAAVYGVSYAYKLHYLVNMIAAWLVIIHSTSESWTLTGVGSFFDGASPHDTKRGKTP